MTYLSLAAGVKGAFFFIHQYMPDYLHGLTDPLTGQAQPLYETVSQLAKELQTLAPLLLSAKPGAPQGHVMGTVRVGCLQTADGKPLYILANKEPGQPTEATLTSVPGVRYRNALTGEAVEVVEGKLTVKLGAGEGRILVGE